MYVSFFCVLDKIRKKRRMNHFEQTSEFIDTFIFVYIIDISCKILHLSISNT